MSRLFRFFGGRKAFQAFLAALLETVAYVVVAAILVQREADPALLVEITKLYFGALGGTLVGAAWAIAWEDRSSLSTLAKEIGGAAARKGSEEPEPGER